MTEENNPTDNPNDDQRVYVGFHQLGGIRLAAGDVRLEPAEAFVLAGQLIAHATMIINFGYMAQAQEAEQVNAITRSITLPPGVVK